jgi:hypothetical protein
MSRQVWNDRRREALSVASVNAMPIGGQVNNNSLFKTLESI